MSVSDAFNTLAPDLPVIEVIDFDSGLESRYRAMARKLGLEIRFYCSYRDYLSDRRGRIASCTVISADGTIAEVVESVSEVSSSELDRPLILALDRAQSEAAFDLVTPSTISILMRPIDFAELEGFVAFAVRHRQFKCDLARKHDRFQQTVGMLSDRQKQILELLTNGIPNKTIATRLRVSQRTIETDRARVLKAFQVETTTKLALLVGEFRLLQQIRRNQAEDLTLRLRDIHQSSSPKELTAHKPHSGHLESKRPLSKQQKADSYGPTVR